MSSGVEDLCAAGREEPFDELSAWIFSPTLSRHSNLMRAQRGNLYLPGGLRTVVATPPGGSTARDRGTSPERPAG